jgi:hypothetical protein
MNLLAMNALYLFPGPDIVILEDVLIAGIARRTHFQIKFRIGAGSRDRTGTFKRVS